MNAPFDAVFAIMEEAFPPCEMRDKEGQRALLNRPEYRLHVYPGPDGAPGALLAVWEFDSFRYVEHLAVGKSLRGGGMGGRMMAGYLREDTRPVVLEVEPPETGIARRRIGFYQRLGFFLNGYPYEQPPLREDTGWCPLLVMSYPAPLTEAEFDTVRDELYQKVYGLGPEKRKK